MKEETSTDSLLESVKNYSVTWLELIRLRTINSASEIVSESFPLILITVLLLGFLFFVNLGVALWLGTLMGRTYAGFLVIAGFYLFLTLIFRFLMRGWLRRSAANYFIRLFFRK